MGTRIGIAFLALLLALPAAFASAKPPPLRNPALLNIGFICHWQATCMERQERAMKKALAYVDKRRPPAWKIQLCNRNASRSRSYGDWRRGRVDWIGFNNCVRNRRLDPPRSIRRRR
jgi:hypothetical protein